MRHFRLADTSLICSFYKASRHSGANVCLLRSHQCCFSCALTLHAHPKRHAVCALKPCLHELPLLRMLHCYRNAPIKENVGVLNILEQSYLDIPDRRHAGQHDGIAVSTQKQKATAYLFPQLNWPQHEIFQFFFCRYSITWPSDNSDVFPSPLRSQLRETLVLNPIFLFMDKSQWN